MKIKLLALICVLAILAGTLGMTVTAETQTTGVFQAGYASVDINPYWSIYDGERKPATMTDEDIMPLPMAGYGDNAHRLSDSVLYDVNGDGKVSGPDGDGLHATVLAIRSGDKTTLFVTVDLISVKSALTKQIRAAITEATGIPDTLITVAGTHTHNGVDMTVSFTTSGEPFKSADGATSYTAEECNAYLKTYKAYLISKLAEEFSVQASCFQIVFCICQKLSRDLTGFFNAIEAHIGIFGLFFVAAYRFSQLFCAGSHIEDVIGDLESQADFLCISNCSVDFLCRSSCKNTAHFTGCSNQRTGFQCVGLTKKFFADIGFLFICHVHDLSADHTINTDGF